MEKPFSVITVLSLALLSVSSQHNSIAFGPPHDKVIVLNVTTLNSNVYSSDKAWLVLFHDGWVGGDYAVNYGLQCKKFAEDVNDWRNIVVIAAFDCSLLENRGTCYKFRVDNTTLKFFPPHSPRYDRPVFVPDERDIQYAHQDLKNPPSGERFSLLKLDLIDTLETFFPKLLKLTNSPGSDMQPLLISTDELYYPEKPTAVVVIFEEENSYLGKEVTLKMSIFKFIKVYRFSRFNNIYDDLNLDTWPAAGFISQNGTAQRIDMGQIDWVKAISKAVLKNAGVLNKSDETTEPPAPVDPRLSIEIDAANKSTTDMVSMDDLLHTLHDALHSEIPKEMPIQGAKLEALEKFLKTVVIFLPTNRRDVRVYFSQLHDWVRTKTTIEATDFERTLERLESRFRPWLGVDLNQWDDCKDTLADSRCYMWGLWRLFYTVTLRSFIGALGGIHGYVKEFFGCEPCKEHFLRMLKRDNILAKKGRRTQALWLWKAQNEINMRTNGTGNENPKQYYPTKKNCPECFDAKGNYMESKVLDYLSRVYTQPRRSIARQRMEKAAESRGLIRINHARELGLFFKNPYMVPNRYFSFGVLDKCLSKNEMSGFPGTFMWYSRRPRND